MRSIRSRFRWPASTPTRRPRPSASNSGLLIVIVGRFVSDEVYAFWTVVCDAPFVKKNSSA